MQRIAYLTVVLASLDFIVSHSIESQQTYFSLKFSTSRPIISHEIKALSRI